MKHMVGILALVASLPIALQGCAPVLIGGTAVGVSVIHDRRDSATVIEDQKIELQVLAKISEDASLGEHSSIGVTSYNKVVLLTGTAETEDVKSRVGAIVGGYPQVVRIVDEIAIGPRPSLQQESHDAYLTSRAKLTLFELRMPNFDPSRIKVVTDHEVVYLMGLVTAEEAAAVVKRIRYVPGIKRVVKIFEYIEPQNT